jgi:hypothetical protein
MGSYVARSKSRSGDEGFTFGFLLGPIGLLVLALMPAGAPPAARTAVEPVEPEPDREAPRSRAMVASERDDVAMDFTMELIRRAERGKPSIPRIPRGE